MADEWDTGAEESEFVQDKFNKYDANRITEVSEHDEGSKEVVQSTPKPEVKETTFERVELHQAPQRSQPPPTSSPKSKPRKGSPKNSPKTKKNSHVQTASPLKLEHKTVLPPLAKPQAVEASSGGAAFTAKLDPEALAYFNDLSKKPFSVQAVAFLNAYWQEVGSQAEFIFTCAWEKIKYADMHAHGVSYIHLYDEGNDLDFNIGLYFYEKLCKEVLEEPAGRKWRDDPHYKPSMPTMMTAIVRKQELREKVDVNFDGKISFLEYLLYQYREYANPADFVERSMAQGTEHPEIAKARRALEDVNKAIREYEKEKSRLEAEAKLPGVKGLGAKQQLNILNASPLAETLNEALIRAEAAVRIATKKFGGASFEPGSTAAPSSSGGAIWWMNRDLEEKQIRYGRKQ